MRKLIFLFFTLLYVFSIAQDRPKVGVVLSGGGAKGYAHIGALKVLEEAGVEIDFIGGTSIGAIVGGLYASGYSASELEQIMYSLDLNSLILNDKTRKELPFFDKTYREKYILELPFDNFKLGFPNAISSGHGTMETLTYLFRHVHEVEDFNELPIPFVTVATKLSTGESVVFNSGFLPEVVMASGAYPSLLEPVVINGEKYVDGGVRNNYPVQEVIDLGADYIIGIDIQDGLLQDDDINSAAKVIEQIITYNIAEKSSEQKQLVDLTIKPILKGYTVTSFNDKDSIINAGTKAAREKWDDLVKIAQLQNTPPKKALNIDDNKYLLITEIEIDGLKTFNKSYIKGKLGLNTPQLANYDLIREGVNRLYSSGNFNQVNYKVVKNTDGHNKLILKVIEKPGKKFLKFGLHYDDLFKTSLLLNFTTKHFLFVNSTLSIDLILGDFPRYEINYFIDNGYYPSFGFNSSYKQFKEEINLQIYDPNAEKSYLDYQYNEILNQFYVQSTYAEKFALGGGIEHQYIDIKTNNLPGSSYYKRIDNGYYLSAYGFIKADNLDNPNYPRKGIKFDGNLKYIFSSNTDNFNETSMASLNFEANQSLNKWLSLKFFGSFGTYFSKYPPISQKFMLGGYTHQKFINYSKFYGLPFAYEIGNNLLSIGSSLQGKFLRNHYVSIFGNIGNLENNFKDIRVLDYKYAGYGIGYGYDSPLGPINGYWTYSPNTKKGLFNVSLGFWF